MTLCQSSEHLQDTLLTKLPGQFIELRNAQLFKRLESLTRDWIVFFSSMQHFEKLGINLTAKSTYMKEDCGLKKKKRKQALRETGFSR